MIDSYCFKYAALCAALLCSPLTSAEAVWSQDRQWLLGDWQGKRQALAEQGYNFNVSYTVQGASLLDGGQSQSNKTRAASQLAFAGAFDLEKIAGWKNTSASLIISKRDGRNLAPYVDMQGSPMEIHGRGNIWRLTQAWIKTGLLDNNLQVKFGRMGMSEDFNGSQCEFQLLLLCGGQVAKSQGNTWYNYPVSGWAINAKYQLTPEWSIAAGVYENNPENLRSDRKTNFNLDMDDTQGAIIPLELAWKTKRINGLKGEYKLGGFYTTHDYDRLDHPDQQQSKRALWIGAQQQLTARPDNEQRGWYAAVNLVFNDDALTTVSSTQQVALWYKGPFAARPQDQIGIGAGRYVFNDSLAEYAGRNDEIDLELNYVLNWSAAISLRPNLQYVYQPKGNSSTDDAWIAGLSAVFKF